MAVQNPFFGRREPEPFQPRTGGGVLPGNLGNAMPAASMGSGLGASSTAPSAAVSDSGGSSGGGSKLTVGPNIKLKGVEITDCDTLVVEGTVEATMDSRVIQIAEQGAFRGSADIDIAEIHGEFDGTLNVREKLVIFSTGRVTGKIRYGKLVVEEGGQLSGEIGMGVGKGNASRPAPASASGSAAPGSSAAPAAAAQPVRGSDAAPEAAGSAAASSPSASAATS